MKFSAILATSMGPYKRGYNVQCHNMKNNDVEYQIFTNVNVQNKNPMSKFAIVKYQSKYLQDSVNCHNLKKANVQNKNLKKANVQNKFCKKLMSIPDRYNLKTANVQCKNMIYQGPIYLMKIP